MQRPEIQTNKLASAVLNLVQPLSRDHNLKQAKTAQKEAVMQSNPQSQVSSSKITPKDTNTEQQRRDQFLKNLSSKQQVDVLLWAEKHNIKPSDPTWLLVDMLGYTRHYTETLPNQIKAVSQQTVDAISSQRKAEGEAFAYKSMKMLDSVLTEMTEKIMRETNTLTDHRMRKKLHIHSLWVTAGMLLFAAICFLTGFLVGLGNIYWLNNPAENTFLRAMQVIVNVPVGYIALSTSITALIVQTIHWIKNK